MEGGGRGGGMGDRASIKSGMDWMLDVLCLCLCLCLCICLCLGLCLCPPSPPPPHTHSLTHNTHLPRTVYSGEKNQPRLMTSTSCFIFSTKLPGGGLSSPARVTGIACLLLKNVFSYCRTCSLTMCVYANRDCVSQVC